ncbi:MULTISPECIES: type II secretory pathway component [unclassified Colwellia]|uniref:type II secretory pathway component n=1 Tax=unclassified Colwellia TaxID=196834 RepID=UPI0015F52FCE|nr:MULTISPECIES: type II secretory pathway component [unclassified Colwellia]MBA6348451.1 type II secretory pathway component [Colwellia sp. BRX8-9]MBA6364992.1 type II secretory pathway component [Colwellia sp. BRX8-8]MBA6369821.1 type II secretory pathway component [Colwellia sp. BRX8-4]
MFHSDRSINLHKRDDCVIQVTAKQKGSAIVIAIFVIVVMALLGAGLVKILSSSAESVAYEVIGTRAYAAAQTGAQWQLLEVFPHDTDIRTTCQNIIIEPDFSNVKGLENCEALVTCNDDGEFDGTTYYIITSTGQCSIGGVITSRTVKIEARSL